MSSLLSSLRSPSHKMLLPTYQLLLLLPCLIPSILAADPLNSFDCVGRDCVTSGSDLINLDVTSAARRQTPVCNYYFEDVHKHTSPNYAYLPTGYIGLCGITIRVDCGAGSRTLTVVGIGSGLRQRIGVPRKIAEDCGFKTRAQPVHVHF